MSNILDIQREITLLNVTIKQIESYRKQWPGGLKPKLLSRLRYINDSFMPTYGYVTEQSDETNRGAVFLVMPPLTSSISNVHTGVHHTQHGGYLQFIQTINGQISVLVWYPYVEGVTTIKEPEILKTLPPDNIDDRAIDSFVVTFIGKMNEWFQAEELRAAPIGFKSQRPPIA